ncbi:hypothetical protein ACW910_24365 (plasmid) [Burkholderia ambifaria]
MTEPILTREEALELAVDAFGIDYDRLDARFENYARAIEAAVLEKVCGEPVAYACSASNDFAPIIRDKAAAKKLSEEHGDGQIVSLYALTRSKP